jgi:hypothetical protein
MKIDLTSSKSKQSITNVRSQITDAGDLRNFDQFLAKHDSIDTNVASDVEAAKGSCSNSCGNVTISPTITFPPK